MTKRTKKKCPHCKVGNYAQGKSNADGRPAFRCTLCGYLWVCGLDGGEWLLREPSGDDEVI